MDRGVVLVTGASGRLGTLICTALRGDGWFVRALRHRRMPAVYDELVEGSLASRATLDAAVAGADVVLHLAAVTHARSRARYQDVNVAGTSNVLYAARAAGVARFVFVSSRAAVDGGGAYSSSKVEAEALVRGAGLSYTIVRLPEIYGAGGRDGVDAVIRQARAGRAVPVVAGASARVCPIHADDAVRALVAVLESSGTAGKTYTLAGECLTLEEFARVCVGLFESRSSIVRLPVWGVRAVAPLSRLLPLPIYPDQLARLLAPKTEVSPDAASELGFQPRTLAEGLQVRDAGRNALN